MHFLIKRQVPFPRGQDTPNMQGKQMAAKRRTQKSTTISLWTYTMSMNRIYPNQVVTKL